MRRLICTLSMLLENATSKHKLQMYVRKQCIQPRMPLVGGVGWGSNSVWRIQLMQMHAEFKVGTFLQFILSFNQSP